MNCPQHIPQKLDAAIVGATIHDLKERIAVLEAESAELRRRSEGERRKQANTATESVAESTSAGVVTRRQ